MNDMEDRIAAALHAAVDGLREQDLRPAVPPVGQPGRRRAVRWGAPLLTAAAVAAAIATTFALTSSPSASHKQQPSAPSPSVPVSAPAPEPTAPPTTTAPAPPPPAHTTVAPTQAPNPPTPRLGYVPLWPFANPAEAAHWENVDGPNGHSPWHADAKATALFFVTGYLQFHDITEVTSADIRADRADVGVGFELPSGQKQTASVIHLVRYGDGNAPWEVLSATAHGFWLDTPATGALTTSPLTVLGRITGVDENITVAVRTLAGVFDAANAFPAGGNLRPWSVSFRTTASGPTTLVASTGGGLTAHGRFAVNGIKLAR
jgi:hypothetical protein